MGREGLALPETRLGLMRGAWIVGLSALTVGLGLGRGGRLTYHEAHVAEAAREMSAGGDVLVPTIGGRPWLEKPPLAIWLVALSGRLAGGIDEAAARAPAAMAATLLAVGTATLAAYRFGTTVGLLAGLVQATTAWTVIRGRLAEADILLASLVTWTIVAFDRIRIEVGRNRDPDREDEGRRGWQLLFWMGLGLTALVKGVGFGGALVGVTVALVLAWDGDGRTLRRLGSPRGWALAGLLALAWPALVLVRYPEALRLWTSHVAGRLGDRPDDFAGGPWWIYGPAVLGQVLPWTPLALLGAGRSLARAARRKDDARNAGDRLLWSWAVGPVALLSLASVKNPHYIIHTLPPWSIWAALSLVRLGGRLQGLGWSPARLRRWVVFGFGGLGLACGLGFALLGPWLDGRGRGAEWAFYEAAGNCLRPGEPLVLLYDDWDRRPYPTPFGPVPHDLAVRLYYLGPGRDQATCWRFGVDALAGEPPACVPAGDAAGTFALIGRDRDVPALRRLGRVETIVRGPVHRARLSKVDDRTFRLFRVTPPSETAIRVVPAAPRR